MLKFQKLLPMPIDYSRYPADWKEIVKRIRKRSGDKCEECGLENKSWVFSVPFMMRDEETRRYKRRNIWFQMRADALREAKEEYMVREVRVILTVAHLDHDEENHEVSDDRLKHMCQVCHLRYDAKEKYRRSLKN